MMKDNYMGRSVPQDYKPGIMRPPGGGKGPKRRGPKPSNKTVSDLEKMVAGKVGDAMGGIRSATRPAAKMVDRGVASLGKLIR